MQFTALEHGTCFRGWSCIEIQRANACAAICTTFLLNTELEKKTLQRQRSNSILSSCQTKSCDTSSTPSRFLLHSPYILFIIELSCLSCKRRTLHCSVWRRAAPQHRHSGGLWQRLGLADAENLPVCFYEASFAWRYRSAQEGPPLLPSPCVCVSRKV